MLDRQRVSKRQGKMRKHGECCSMDVVQWIEKNHVFPYSKFKSIRFCHHGHDHCNREPMTPHEATISDSVYDFVKTGILPVVLRRVRNPNRIKA